MFIVQQSHDYPTKHYEPKPRNTMNGLCIMNLNPEIQSLKTHEVFIVQQSHDYPTKHYTETVKTLEIKGHTTITTITFLIILSS